MGIRDDMPLMITKCQAYNFQQLGNITILRRLHVSPPCDSTYGGGEVDPLAETCDPAYALLLMRGLLMLVMLLLLLLVLLLLLLLVLLL